MTVITDKKITEDAISFTVKSVAKKPVALVCLLENEDYTVRTSGKVSHFCGVYTI